MKLIRDLKAVPDRLRAGAVAIGNFDGVHLGHAQIISRLLAQSQVVGGPAVVFTFDPHPVRLLRPEQAPFPLTWTDRKVALLSELGVDAVIAYRTDLELLQLSARQFFDHVLRDRLDARAVVEGPNFYFGRDRAGNIEVLGQFAAEAGMALEVVPGVMVDGQLVSSSRVRQLISAGDVAAARRLLTRPYRIRGMVTHGAGRGAGLGFPTANVSAVDTLLPGHGVYAGRAYAQGASHAAAINLGPNPTFGEQATKVEVHLVDAEVDLYGQPLEVDFLARLREIQRFANIEEIKAQISRDVARARAVAHEHPERS